MTFIIGTILQTITISLSIYILFQGKLSKKLLFLMMAIGILLGYPLYMWQGTAGIFLLLLLWIISLLIAKKGIINSVIFSVITLINLVLSDYIINLAMLTIINDSAFHNVENISKQMIYIVASCILGLVFSIIETYFLSVFNRKISMMKSYGIMIASLSIVTLIVFYVNIFIGKQSGFSEDNIRANSVLFICYFIILIGVCILITRLILKETNVRNQQEQFERLTEYTSNLEQMYTNMQKFRHDYINILLSMSEYIRQRDIDNLESYFNQHIVPISSHMKSNNYKLGSLHNLKMQELKGIISSKIIKAQEMNIDANVEVVEEVNKINMSPVDLCRCVGIILDNAIEEAIHCDNPFVHVAIIRHQGSYSIIVSNSSRQITPQLHVIYQKGFSTKGENRGLGLNNLKEIVNSHNNTTLDTQILADKFTQILEIKD